MSLKVATRQVNDVTIVELIGQIKLGEGNVVLREAVKDLLDKGQKKIVLDLDNIDSIDSPGVGELVSAFTSVHNQGGELKFLHLSKKVRDLLHIDISDDDESGGLVAV